MADALIPIFERDGQQVASGREIHKALSIGTRYDTWFSRMLDYGFDPGEDYVVISEHVPSERSDRTYQQVDHAVSLDMAKQLGMIQRTPEGRRVREYFIEAEKRARQQPAELTREEILRLALAAEEEKKVLEAKVAEDAPKVDYHERFVSPPDDAVTVEFFAAQFGVTEPHVRTLMKDRGVAVRREIGKRWSKSKGRMEPEYEWRPAAGPALEWFELRPQHNAPRHHNGQVRQTMYVRQFYADQLAQKLGLATPTLTEETP